MTLLSLPHPIIYPGGLAFASVAAFTGAVTLDAAGEYLSYIVKASQDMVISHVGFRPQTVSGSPTADVRIETVDASGFPSGTLWATNTNIVTETLTTAWGLHALTASASISKGQLFAVKFAYNSGTSFNPGNLQSTWVQAAWGPVYRVINTGTPAKSFPTNIGDIALGSSTTSFYSMPGLIAADAVTNTNFNSGSGTIRYGLRFQIPFAARVRGVSFNSNQSGDFTVGLYDDAGTLLGSSDVDGDIPIHGFPFPIDADVVLSKDTWYRATIEATTVTNQVVSRITMPSANYIGATPWAANAHLTTWNGSAWDDSQTAELPLMNISIDQIDDGTGSGAAGGGHILGGTVVR